ncbi:MAG: PKD domain-containing protein, partial [Actinomycetes bacterium]
SSACVASALALGDTDMAKRLVHLGVLGVAVIALAGCTMPPPTPVTTTTTDPSATTTTTEVTTTTTEPTTTTTTIPNEAPTAAIAADETYGQVDLTVNFSATDSTDSDGTIVTASWDFGDGSAVETGLTATHTYTTVGTYTATVTVTDDGGATDTASVSIDAVTRSTTVVSPATGTAGTAVQATVACAPLEGWVDGALAIASVLAPDGSVVAFSSTPNADPNTPTVVVNVQIPAGSDPGRYAIASSCDSYLGSTAFAPVPFKVTAS